MSITSINPATTEELKSYEPMTRSEALAAVEKSHEAYKEWRQTDFARRRNAILEFARRLRDHKDEYAQLITMEMGKRISESRDEIEFCAEIAEFYARGAEDFLADRTLNVDGAEATIHYEPIGALLGVMPWNFPFYQVTRFATPNIMAGNTVLLKHAGNVPQCAERIEQLFHKCGVPEGVYINLLIPNEFVEPIIADDRIRGVSLTGSEKAGAAVAALAGKHLKPSVLELGGNDPFIVLEDADLDRVIEMAVKGRMVNAGQSCVAAKRFIVVEEVADAFLSAFKEKMAGLQMGDPLDPDTDVAPLSSASALERLEEQVEKTVDAGATVLLGGRRADRTGAFYEPTILTDVQPDMPSYDQELFGPVATVYIVKDEEEAVDLANDSSFGLGGSIYTRDIRRGRQLAEKIETGMVFINQPTNSQAELPFGGVKNSGYGRELSHLGILEFVNKKLIHSTENAGKS